MDNIEIKMLKNIGKFKKDVTYSINQKLAKFFVDKARIAEYIEKTVEEVIKDVNDKIDDFRANPEFDKATFHGNVLFEGNTTVEGNTTTKGNSTVNGNQVINGMLDVYNKITAHGNPVGLEVDHKIVCNDLSVNGVFRGPLS